MATSDRPPPADAQRRGPLRLIATVLLLAAVAAGCEPGPRPESGPTPPPAGPAAGPAPEIASGSHPDGSSPDRSSPDGSSPDRSSTGPGDTPLLPLDGRPPGSLPPDHASPPGCARWTGSTVATRRDGCTIRTVTWTGDFTVTHDRTTLSYVRIVGPGTEAANDMIVTVNWGGGDHTGTEIDHSDIHSGSPQGSVYCVAGFGFTLRRDDIWGCTHLVNLYGQDDHVTIADSWLHTPIAESGDHVELLYASPGASDVALTGDNWVVSPAGQTTAALFLDGYDEDRAWTIDRNWFDGSVPGASNWGSIQADTSGITFRSNRIGVNSSRGPYDFGRHPPEPGGRNVWMYSAATPPGWPAGSGPVIGGQEIPGL